MRQRFLVLLLVTSAAWSSPAAARSLGELDGELTQLQAALDQYLRALKLPHVSSRRALTKRLLDGVILFRMGDYDKAASVFTDLVSNHPGTSAAAQAKFYLAECLYHRREYRTAARHYQAVVDKGAGEFYQKALLRLLEIAFKTGRHGGVYLLVQKIQALPASERDPSMEYVLGKYYYFRGLLDRADKVFRSLAPTGPYGLRARYFVGVIAVRHKQFKKAEAIFKELMAKLAPLSRGRTAKARKMRELKDLSMLALARLYYSQDKPDEAIGLYRTISRRSPFFEEALHELAWAYLRAWEFYRAIHTLQLLIVLSPNSRYVAESKIMMANLKVVARDYDEARKLFRQTARSYRPIYLKLRALARRRVAPEKYLQALTSQGPSALDVDFDLPRRVVRELRKQSQVRKALAMLGDVDEIRAGIRECEKILRRVEARLSSGARASAFPQVAKGRAVAAELDIRLTQIERELMAKLQADLLPSATGAERAELERLRARKAELGKLIEAMPRSGDAFRARIAKMKRLYEEKEAEIHKLSIAIDALGAVLAAIKNYYESTRSRQKLAASIVMGKVATLNRTIEGLRSRLLQLRSEVEDAKSSAGVDDATMREEKRVRRSFEAILAREKAILSGIEARLGGSVRAQVSHVRTLLDKAQSVRKQLSDYQGRLDSLLAVKLGRARRILQEERANIARYKSLLAQYSPEARSVAGGVASQGFQNAATVVRELLIKADVGVLDVAWALKSDRSEDWAEHVRRQAKRLMDLDKRFQEVRAR